MHANINTFTTPCTYINTHENVHVSLHDCHLYY